MFTKEHYIEIAKLLSAVHKQVPFVSAKMLCEMAVDDFVLFFKMDSPKFNDEKFLDAIYGKEGK